MTSSIKALLIIAVIIMAITLFLCGPRAKLSRHFHRNEFACAHCGQVRVDPQLIKALQQLRNRVKRPIIVTSGYRCPPHNHHVGGTQKSRHLKGQAADIYARGLTVRQLFQHAINIPAFRDGGLGLDETRAYLHVDLRPIPYHWRVIDGQIRPIQE